MGKNKAAPVRRPVKARGTIPVPRVGHRAARLPWYRHRQVQVIGGLILIVVLGFAVQQFMAWRDRVGATQTERKAVKAYFDKVQAIQGQIIGPLGEMATKPDQFRNGQLKPDDYKAAAQTWLTAFQRMATDLRSQNPPASLLQTRAHMTEAAVVFIDAIRTYQLAAQTSEVPVRDQAILLAARESNHAETLYTNALKQLQKEQKRLGLPTGQADETPVLPQEDESATPGATPAPSPAASPPASPAPTPAG